MAKTKTVRVSDAELELLKQLREGTVTLPSEQPVAEPTGEAAVVTEAQKALADAFATAIERTRPTEKKTVQNRKKNTPWTNKDGTPKPKLKRKMYQHGLLIDPEKVTADQIHLLNKIRPGVYCNGWVTVKTRKDRGLDIDYAVRTVSQRLKLVNVHGIRSFTELLQRLIDENANPKKYARPDDLDLYENE